MLNGANRPKQWQPISAEICALPISCCVSFSAEKTGRSGQPVQKVGGRGGRSRNAVETAGHMRNHLAETIGDRVDIETRRPRFGEKLRKTFQQNVLRILAGFRQHVLAMEARLHIAAAQFGRHHLLDIFGEAFLDDQHRFLVGTE